MQILVVEDEPRMAALLGQTLREEGHQVMVAKDGREGLEIALTTPFDVIVLDVMLPATGWVALTRRLRDRRNQTPVLMLTGRDSPADVIAGLDCGADDYLTKPFAIDVFLRALRSVSRRGAIPRPALLELADLVADPANRSVTRGGRAVSLTRREYTLLELLMRNMGRALSRDAILESVWGFDSDVTPNIVEVFMRLLRQKIDTHDPKLIHTIRGFGYVMREPL